MENLIKKEVGYVTKVNSYLLSIKGLPSARINDIIVDEEGRKAVVHSLLPGSIEALFLDNKPASPGIEFFIDSEGSRIHIGEHLKGKVLNALGEVVSDNGIGKRYKGNFSEKLSFDKKARDIDSRSFIDRQLVTGFALVDITLPIGKGQRELIYGPIHSGKNDFLRDVAINQKELQNICIYAAIGKPVNFTSGLIKVLEENDAMDNTIIVSALSDESAPMISIAPSTAFLIAEHFCNQGKDVVLILDDLGIHAKYLREIALLSNQFPGRESYPGDMFYRHASLMERSGSFNDKQGNGTITLLPVLETDMEGFTNMIPTNLMGSTDGHLLFSKEIHAEGFKPAISVLQSVTRVGHATHNKIQRELSTSIINILSEYPRQQEYSRFGTQLSSHARDILKRGRIISELMNQKNIGFLSLTTQILLLALVFTRFFEPEDRDLDFIGFERENIIKTLEEGKSLAGAREMTSSKDLGFSDLLIELEKGINELEVATGKNKDSSSSSNIVKEKDKEPVEDDKDIGVAEEE